MQFKRYNEYPKLQQAQTKLQELQEEEKILSAAADASRSTVTRLQSEMDELEACCLIGDATPASVEESKAQKAKAIAAASSDADKLKANRRAQELMQGKINNLMPEAIEWAVKQVHPPYREAVRKMQRALVELEKANAAVLEIQKAAIEAFPRKGNPHNAGYPVAAGIPFLAVDMFQDQDSAAGGFHSDSQFKQWMAVAEEYLK